MVKSRKKIGGFNLVELMVAVTISVIAMAMAVGIYTSIKQQYKKTTESHESNLNQLLAKQVLQNAINSAGYDLRATVSSLKYVDTTGNYSDIFDKYKMITIGKVPVNSTFVSRELSEKHCTEKSKCYQPETDYLLIQKNGEVQGSIKALPAPNIIDLDTELADKMKIEQDEYLLICNQEECDLARVYSIEGNRITLYQAPNAKFTKGDYISKYLIEIYFIGDSGRKDKEGNPINALFLYIKQGDGIENTYEMVDKLSDLEIAYVLKDDLVYHEQVKWTSVNDVVSFWGAELAALKLSFKSKGKPFEQIIIFYKVEK